MMKSPGTLRPGYVLSFLSGALISFLGAQAYQAYQSAGYNSKNHRNKTPPPPLRRGGNPRSIFFVPTSRRDDALDPTTNDMENVQEEGEDENNKEEGDTKKSRIMMDSPDLDYRLIRKAEAVIQGRTSRIIIVVERCTNDHNYSAILRTAEALGVQNLWIIDPPPAPAVVEQGKHHDQHHRPVVRTAAEETERVSHTLFAQRAQEWLTLRTFSTTQDCLVALRQEKYEIWVTDLSQHAVPLDELKAVTTANTALTSNGNDDDQRRLAIVMGTEAVGCSREMLEGADLRVYLPLVGFADSLNLSVATALVVQYIMEFVYPAAKHCMDEAERQALREVWYPKLARQRLLTAHEKRDLKLMKKTIDECERLLQVQRNRNNQGLVEVQLTEGQETKLRGLAALRIQFDAANAALDEKSRASVRHLLLNPPRPLGDLRRADVHRVSYVGKATKRFYQQYWKDMPAVASAKGSENSSSTDFRRGLVTSVDDETNNTTTME
jgi:tRNA G18 (ribose-2'-O)-methylase SpoU